MGCWFWWTVRWPIANLLDFGEFWIWLRLCHARSGCPFPASDCDCRPTRRSRRRAFCCRRIRSRQATTPDPQSFPAAVTEFARIRSHRRRLMCAPDASRSADPFRNRIETIHALGRPSSAEKSEISPAVLAQVTEETGPTGTPPGNHCSGRPNETTESHLGLSADRSTDRFGL